MTAYWDSWAGLVEARVSEGVIKEALQELIQSLHDWEHGHGGHTLDSYLEQNSLLVALLRRVREV